MTEPEGPVLSLTDAVIAVTAAMRDIALKQRFDNPCVETILFAGGVEATCQAIDKVVEVYVSGATSDG